MFEFIATAFGTPDSRLGGVLAGFDAALAALVWAVADVVLSSRAPLGRA